MSIASESLVRWTPKHERVVLLHVAGRDNIEIAELVDYSEARVSHIINSPQGKKLIEELRTRMKNNLMAGIEGELRVMAHQSLDNLKKTVGTRVPFDEAHIKTKRHQDLVGLELLGIMGYSKRRSGPKEEAKPHLTPELGERLARALEKSAQVQPIIVSDETGIVDADYEIIDDNGGSPQTQ